VKSELPELPAARRRRFVELLQLPSYDAEVLTATRELADYYEAVVKAHGDAKVAANWVMGSVLARLKDSDETMREFKVEPQKLAALLAMVREGSVSNTAAKTIFAQMAESGGDPAAIAEREGLRQVSDDSQLIAWIDQVMAAHPDEARRFEAGDRKLLGVLVGMVMKASGGKADPKKVNLLLGKRVGA
jgi:aspartyl-tRNA(Asn)/glutamyl-tRNA(Gln) amidotransferase subunit B